LLFVFIDISIIFSDALLAVRVEKLEGLKLMSKCCLLDGEDEPKKGKLVWSEEMNRLRDREITL